MTILPAARAVFRGLRSAKNRVHNAIDPPVLVLAYHRVADLASDPQGLAVGAERFRAQMRHLRERYALLRMEEPWPRNGHPAAVVTFDDGYADNATVALPILESERVPATFFVSVGAVESGREFWWDELERWLGSDDAQYRKLHAAIRNLAPADRERRLDEVRAASGGDGSPRPTHRPLTPEEVARLGKSSWATVGAHGVSHTPFAALSLPEQREEMRASRERLRAWSGTPVDTFSFPFGGRADFSRDSVRVARETGFRRIAANIPGQARRLGNPFVVPRFLVRDWDAGRFASELHRFETA